MPHTANRIKRLALSAFAAVGELQIRIAFAAGNLLERAVLMVGAQKDIAVRAGSHTQEEQSG